MNLIGTLAAIAVLAVCSAYAVAIYLAVMEA